MKKSQITFAALVVAFIILPAVLQGKNSDLAKIKTNVMQAFPLDSTQVDSLNKIFTAFKLYGDGDYRKFAYIVATAWHESRLRPIKEIKAADGTTVWENYQKKYWYTGFYGRGFVQITWEANYKKMGDRLGIDLVGNKDLALRPDVAAKIIVVGMMEGMFTGKRLSDYFIADTADSYNARRVVGAIMVAGKDTALMIQNHYQKIFG